MVAAPAPLVRGVLYCEEGTTYLRYARETRSWLALTAPHQGYYSLLPNVATLLASHWLPLFYIPLALAWTAFTAHLCIAWLAAETETFTTFDQRAVAVAICLCALGSARDLDGTINSQYFFGIGAMLLLLSDETRLRFSRTALLLIFGLDGVFACMLAPLFWLKALRRKTVVAYAQVSLLSCCALIQGVVVVHSAPYANRGLNHVPVALRAAGLASNAVVLPFLSRVVYWPLTAFLAAHTAHPYWLILLPLGAGGLAILCWSVGVRRHLPLAMLVSGLLISAVAAATSVADTSDMVRTVIADGDRYYVAGNAMVAVGLLLAALQTPASTSRGRSLRVLLAVVLASGLLDYARYWRSNQYSPQWSGQVTAWQQNPSTPLHIAALAWYGNPLFYAPTPLRGELPFYLFDSSLRTSVRDRIPVECFGVHLMPIISNVCRPRGAQAPSHAQ